jgi:hypothetical protein
VTVADDEKPYLIVLDAISGRVLVTVSVVEDIAVHAVRATGPDQAVGRALTAHEAGTRGMSLGTGSRHWQARITAVYRDDPRYNPPERTTHYMAWIGAGSEEEARAVLAKHAEDTQDRDLLRWNLDELQEVTFGDPDVIATWVE